MDNDIENTTVAEMPLESGVRGNGTLAQALKCLSTLTASPWRSTTLKGPLLLDTSHSLWLPFGR
jgi:hypothetical protein